MGYESLTRLARGAVESWIAEKAMPPLPASHEPWNSPKGIFVTLTTRDGDLRGCIGHINPLKSSLCEEVVDCAVAAATRDPRFPSVRPAELEDLEFEISILEPLEQVHSLSSLDPKRYGVVVELGRQRGVLLPDIEGVETVDQQVSIACEKAGIVFSPEVRLYRFEVTKLGDASRVV